VNVSFYANNALWLGGGIYIGASSPTLTSITFSGNSVGIGGGGMGNNRSNPKLMNIAFFSNTAGIGGAMYNLQSSPTLINITFSKNKANKSAGAIHNYKNSNPILTNVIVWDNASTSSGHEAQVSNDETSRPVIAYSDVQDSGGSGAGWTSAFGTDGGGNIDADPLFVDTKANNYHLRPGSPAIDAGNNSIIPLALSVDLEGKPRIVGNSVDMGAYETGQ
jgi:hypothetical protein